MASHQSEQEMNYVSYLLDRVHSREIVLTNEVPLFLASHTSLYGVLQFPILTNDGELNLALLENFALQSSARRPDAIENFNKRAVRVNHAAFDLQIVAQQALQFSGILTDDQKSYFDACDTLASKMLKNVHQLVHDMMVFIEQHFCYCNAITDE